MERAPRGSVWGGASAGKLGGATEEGGVAREARTNQETGRAVGLVLHNKDDNSFCPGVLCNLHTPSI